MFQSRINRIFYDCIVDFRVVYRDGLHIFIKNETYQLENLNKILSRLNEHHWFMSTNIFDIMNHEIIFLGLILVREGRRLDPVKVGVIFTRKIQSHC